jgi:hypothetical protein
MSKARTATFVQQSSRFQDGCYYKLDTPIEFENQTYEYVMTARAKKSSDSLGILTFPTTSQLWVVKHRTNNEGKNLFTADKVMWRTDSFISHERILKNAYIKINKGETK